MKYLEKPAVSRRAFFCLLPCPVRTQPRPYSRNRGAVMLHEWGHWLDWNLIRDGKTLRQQLPNLREFLRKDALDYINRLINPEKGIKSIKEAVRLPYAKKDKIRADLKKDGDLKNGVSDIFSGLTQDAIAGRYHHPKSYWKGNALEGETIAHFFEAMAAGGEKLEILKRYFPSAFAYFEKAL